MVLGFTTESRSPSTGFRKQRQIRATRGGANTVVATPGRLEDYLRRKLVDLRNVKTPVLDEANRMLDMGFLPALRRIVASLPRQRQTLCVSVWSKATGVCYGVNVRAQYDQDFCANFVLTIR